MMPHGRTMSRTFVTAFCPVFGKSATSERYTRRALRRDSPTSKVQYQIKCGL